MSYSLKTLPPLAFKQAEAFVSLRHIPQDSGRRPAATIATGSPPLLQPDHGLQCKEKPERLRPLSSSLSPKSCCPYFQSQRLFKAHMTSPVPYTAGSPPAANEVRAAESKGSTVCASIKSAQLPETRRNVEIRKWQCHL